MKLHSCVKPILIVLMLSCSVSLHARPRIVGGSNVAIEQIPATVAMLSNRILAQSGSYFQSQMCGGTLIHTRWVMTAAHCVVHDGVVMAANELSVLAGSTDLEAPVNAPIAVTRVIPHSGYSSESSAHDIALLQLEFDAPVTPAQLDTQPVQTNDVAFIAGWGALNDGSTGQQQAFPTRLQGAYVRMVPGEQCGNLFPVYSGQVNGRQVCAGYVGGGVDTCQGDSGGPLYRVPARGEADNLVVTGVTSWGLGCAVAGQPGVYTRAAEYASWLRQYVSFTAPTTGTATQDVILDDQGTGQAPQVLPAETSALTASSGTETGNAVFAVPLLLFALFVRHIRAAIVCRKLCLRAGAMVFLLSATTLFTPLAAEPPVPEQLSVLDFPIGHERDTVIAGIGELWGSEPACTLIRTGVGQDRRSYFLELCQYVNHAYLRIGQQTPTVIEYRFLENQLVQVVIDTASGLQINTSDRNIVPRIHWLRESP